MTDTDWTNPRKMKCPHCGSIRLRKEGIVKGKQRFYCRRCGKTTIIPRGQKRR